MKERPEFYVLVGRTPIAVDRDMWAQNFENVEKRVVALTTIGKVQVSTVFLGMDHNYFAKGPAILFETMVFGGPLDSEMQRYATYAQAEAGHAEFVKRTREAVAKVNSIAKNAGADT